jgi:UDP:flavonoid glycosyltransferase YjiC (YdhE family)
MKITMIALGSRGDVQPAVAMGVGLQRAGHEVKLASYAPFEALATGYGLDFKLVRGDILAFMENESMQEILASGRSNPLGLISNIRDFLRQDLKLSVEDVMDGCEGADVLVTFSAAFYAGASIAEETGQKILSANLQPITPTKAYSNPLLPPPKFESGYFNLFSHHVAIQLTWQMLRPVINETREKIQGLPAWSVKGPWDANYWESIPILYGYSRHVLPRPADWSENNHITGYWFLERQEKWQPSPELEAFLEDGPPPVYVGFGSMKNRDPKETARLVVRALDMAGQRGVLLSGWGGLAEAELPQSIFMVDSVPHDWLFPRMSAVVHHGGAGTTAAGLRAGVPSILIPFFGDQPYWGHHIYRLGVGPKPIRRNKLDAPRLAKAIREAVTSQEMRQKAVELGRKIRSEDGVGTAVSLFNNYFERLSRSDESAR